MTATELMQRARTQLLIQDRFYGIMCMHLELKEDKNCKTAWTDGVTIGYNPLFISMLNDYERMFVFKHEVWHCILGHHLRRETRDSKLWNIAADRVIHSQFVYHEGMKLIKGALYESSDRGKNTETVYDLLQNQQQNKKQADGKDPGAGQGKGQSEGEGEDGNEIGEVRDFKGKGNGQSEGPTSSEKSQEEAKWNQALERAINETKKARGRVPGFAEDLLQAKKHPKINWREALKRFVQESLDNDDYSWMRPNKKYLAQGVYIPSLYTDANTIEHIVFAVDTSGSMSIEDLNQVVDELSIILEEYKTKITVLMVDTQVHSAKEYTNDDLPLTINAIGRGGTDFAPAFNWVTESQIQPTCFLYYTDGCGYFPNQPPDYPVLWIGTYNFTPPFGEYISCK